MRMGKLKQLYNGLKNKIIIDPVFKKRAIRLFNLNESYFPEIKLEFVKVKKPNEQL